MTLKKTHLTISVLLLSIYSISSLAQRTVIAINYQGPFTAGWGKSVEAIDSESFLIYSKQDKKQKVSIYNDQLKEIVKLDVEDNFFGKDRYDIVWGGMDYARIPDLGYSKETDEIQYYQVLKRKGGKTCYGNLYNRSTGKLILSNVLWSKIPKSKNLTIEMSPNRSYTGLYYRSNGKFTVKLVNAKMDIEDEWEVSISSSLEQFDFYVSDKGTIISVFTRKGNKTTVLRVFSKEKDPVDINIPVFFKSSEGDRAIEFARVSEDVLKIIGVIEPEKSNPFNIYIGDFNETNRKITGFKNKGFSRDELEGLYSEVSEDKKLSNTVMADDKKKAKSMEYGIDNVYVKNNKTYIIFEELIYIYSENSNTSRYMAKDMLIMSFDESNNNLWNTGIVKRIWQSGRAGSQGIISDWTPVRSISWLGQNHINLLTPDFRGTGNNRSVFYRTINLETGIDSIPLDIYEDVTDHIYYVANIFCPFTGNKIMLHSRQGWGAGKKVSQLRVIDFKSNF